MPKNVTVLTRAELRDWVRDRLPGRVQAADEAIKRIRDRIEDDIRNLVVAYCRVLSVGRRACTRGAWSYIATRRGVNRGPLFEVQVRGVWRPWPTPRDLWRAIDLLDWEYPITPIWVDAVDGRVTGQGLGNWPPGRE